MNIHLIYMVLTCQILFSVNLYSQPDQDVPVSPLLNLVTVNQPEGSVGITWSLSPSPDVSGYVVYSYQNGEGYALDTLHDPTANAYVKGLASPYFSESFVIAALDSSGNISPLSNELHTIFPKVDLDSCNKKIKVSWNSYSSVPKPVTDYTVLFSVNGGGSYEAAGKVTPDKNDLIIDDFTTDVQYCFIVRANLEGGFTSSSNKACILTKMQTPPRWINADYATISSGNAISLSFTIDPLSEIGSYILERKNSTSDTFRQIAQFTSVQESLLYTDKEADTSKVNFYRLSAKNNCSNPVTVSNIASNIVLSLKQNESDIRLTWNSYRQWAGTLNSYILYINPGDGFKEKLTVDTQDTVLNINYQDIMYEISGSEVCFIIKAVESANPYGINGESRSSQICTRAIEKITVPNVFTPDKDLINDYFLPVLSFTPVRYHLIIANRQGRTVFETKNYNEKWDGTQNGNTLPQEVYLWFLKVTTPSGSNISRTGTVTIINKQ